MKFPLAILFFAFAVGVAAQKEKPKNYRHFDEKLLHFGVILGANKANFNVFPVNDAYQKYGLVSLEAKSQPGGQVGMLVTMKLGTPALRLRFAPTLSLQERVLDYYYKDPNPKITKEVFNEERVSSTNLDFPLMLQFRTLRLNNFASYVLIGGQFSRDMQSQQDASQSLVDPFIKIRKDDMQGQAGIGFEFFAPYFKFGIEVKYSQSFSNSLIQDFTVPSKPIDQLVNKVWWFSIIFEG